ncbi:MAG: uroporphyrinogen-III synthase [Gallionella sp.]|nr:uroporphyrinogen-III synthase [Gallionella sp.]MDD4959711.1 uroporphyrinogen-III synthase [Gallionella sp.]
MANLKGLRILVTRPSHQAGGLTQGILAAGGEPVLFPLLEISPVADTAALHAQISQLADYQLAIFISPNAVEQGVAAIRKVGLKPSCKIATVGQGSAQALRALGFVDILVPCERFDSEGLLALPELQDVAGWRVMIFRGDGGRALLGDTLKARGAIVDYATCYQRSIPLPTAIDWHRLDAITITSSEALTYLRQLVADAQLNIPLFVLHSRIADLAREQGWQHIITTESGDAGLLAALDKWATQQDTALI